MDAKSTFAVGTQVRITYTSSGQALRKKASVAACFSELTETAMHLYFMKFGKMRIDFSVPVEHIASVAAVAETAPGTARVSGGARGSAPAAVPAPAAKVAGPDVGELMAQHRRETHAQLAKFQADIHAQTAAATKLASEQHARLVTATKTANEQVRAIADAHGQKAASADDALRRVSGDLLKKVALVETAIVKLSSDVASLQTGAVRIAKLEAVAATTNNRVNKLIEHIRGQS